MSTILQLAVSRGRCMAALRRNPAALAATVPPWLPGLLLSLVLTAPAWLFFLHPALNLWELYDGEVHLVRSYSLQQYIASGDWYPRWLSEPYSGYGYPYLNFYAPASYYLTALLAWLLPSVGIYGSLQLVGAIGALGMISSVYTLGWKLWRHGPAALCATAIVAYAPYPLPPNLFLRSAIPETLGLALLVWLLVGCTGLWFAATEGRRLTSWWLFTGTITIALLLTHNISSLLGAFITPAWIVCLWLWRPNRRALFLLCGAALGAAVLTAFFWLPALLEIPLVQTDRLHVRDLSYRHYFLTWPGYHSPHWGLQLRSPWTRGFPVDLHLIYPYTLSSGPVPLSLWQGVLFLGALFALTATLLRRMRSATVNRLHAIPQQLGLSGLTVGFGLILAVVCYSQSFDWALPLWEHLPPLRALQFPFRLLAPAGYGIALAAGGVLALWAAPSRRAWVATGLAVVGLGVAGVGGYFTPLAPEVTRGGVRFMPLTSELPRAVSLVPGRLYITTGEFVPKTARFTTWHEDEARGFWLYERMFPDASWLGGRVTGWHGTLTIRQLAGGSLWTSAEVTVEGDEQGILAFHQLAFAGWRAWVDDHPVPATPAPWIATQAIQPGFLLVEVPPGDHRVAIRFGPSGPRLVGATSTLLGWLALATWALIAARRSTTPRHRFARGAASLVLTLAVIIVGARLLLPLWPPPADQPQQRILVSNVIEDLLAGRTTVHSPTGAALGPDRFLDVRHLSVLAQDRPLRDVGPRARRWLKMHPPAAVAITLTLPQNAYLQTGIVLDPAMWQAPLGDGVRFVATITPAGGPETTLFDIPNHPRAQGEHRRWIDVVADLRPWAGQHVQLTLRTAGRQDPANDWAGWGEPVIVQLDPLTGARLLQSSARIQAVTYRP